MVDAQRTDGARRWRRAVGLGGRPHLALRVLAVGALGPILAACGTAAAAPARVQAATTVTFADQPGSAPNYILPLMAAADASDANLGPFQLLMYRPLYWSGANGQPAIDAARSLAAPPVYSDGGHTVTITLKRARWSDGRPVTTRDVQFWMDLLRSDRADYWAYVPGQFPDNVTRMRVLSPLRFALTFNRAYNRTFLLQDELTQIIPLPQHVWDRTRAAGPVGSFDRTPKGARAVYQFLDGQSKRVGTYASNPLWRVVDGPWRLGEYDPATGYAVLVPNAAYAGPGHPTIARLAEVPFTSDAAEFDALRAGAIDYGYVPYEDIGQLGYLGHHGYAIHPWAAWAYNTIAINFANPKLGLAFRQLYLRQAMEHLVDQPTYDATIFGGYAYPDTTLLPSRPSSPLVAPAALRQPYPYSVAAARRLLAARGWRPGSSGVLACHRPGSAAGDCGPGVPAGLKLAVTLEYASEPISVGEEAQALRSAFSRAGIDLLLHPAPLNQVFSQTFLPCDPHTPGSCSWDLGYWGNGWNWSPEGYPDASQTFGVGGVVNSGHYADPTAQRLLTQTQVGSGLGPLHALEGYLARDLPGLWMPLSYYQISAVSTRLRGTEPQDPFLNIYPESWRWA